MTRAECRTKGPIFVAQRVVVTLSDDIDGSEAAETVAFGLDGKSYEIDLNPANAKKLRTALAPFVEAGRKRSKVREERYKHTAVAPDPAAVRAWARSQQDGRPAARPHPQEGLRGVRRRAVTAATAGALGPPPDPAEQPTCAAPPLIS